MKKLITRICAVLAAACGLTALADDPTPYNKITFDDLTVGEIAADTTAANTGSSTTAMTLPAGSVVSVTDTDKAWQFGTTASQPDFGPNGSSMKSTTYATRINLNGGTYSKCHVWGANGTKLGGPCLYVDGSGSSYTVNFGRYDNGQIKSTYVTYHVPASKLTGFHWYAMTISSTGTEVHVYVDGNEVGSSTSAGFTASQNTVFGWGKLGNAGASAVPTGLQVSEFRMYTQVLTRDQVAALAGSYTAEITENTTVAAINAAANGAGLLTLTVADGVTIDYDYNGETIGFDAGDIAITSAGSITLHATDELSAEEFSKLDVSGVAGKVTRSWLTGDQLGIVGMNFNANGGRNNKPTTVNCANTSGALAINGTWYSDPYNTSGSKTISSDGITKLTWSSANVYTTGSKITDGTFKQGYLDDGSGVQITISGVPYDTYDVIIYAATDTANTKFSAKTVNGKTYTYTDGEVVEGTAVWGASSTTPAVAVYGINSMRVNSLTGKLTISSAKATGGRGGIAAIQIMPTGWGQEWKLSLAAGANVNWTTASWQGGTGLTGDYPITDPAEISVAGNATINVDTAVAPADIAIEGETTSVVTLTGMDNYTISGDIASTGPTIKTTKLVFDGGEVEATIAVDYQTELELAVAEGKEGEVDGEINGTGKIVKTGDGKLVLASRGDMAGGIDIQAGTVELSGDGDYSFWDGTAIPVTVADGATLDINGEGGFKAAITLAEGATFANSGDAVGQYSAQASDLTLTGDATVDTDSQFGLVANGYGATTLNLGDNTLTKTGTGDFMLCNTTINGAGTIDIREGTVTIPNYGATASEATFNTAAGTTINVASAFTAKVSGSGTLNYTSSNIGGTVTLADDSAVAVTITLDSWTTSSTMVPVKGTPASVTILNPDGTTAPATYEVTADGIKLTVATVSLTRTNPVTGASQDFVWAFRDTKDNAWATATNWYKAVNSRWSVNPADKAPGVSNTSADPQWGAMLFDGDYIETNEVTATGIEGWHPKYGVFNGMTVKIADMQKIQDFGNNDTWFMVDSTSKLTIGTVSGGNSDGTIPLYVAAADGIEFTKNYGVSGQTFNYFLTGEGSVKFAGLTAGTHNISNATFSVGTGTYKTILSKTLVSYTSKADAATFNVDDATITCTDEGVTATKKTTGDVVPGDALGTYKLSVTSTGVKLTYVGYTSNAGIVATRTVGTDTVGYWTLAGAVGAASAGETITVVNTASGDITISKNLTISEGNEYLSSVNFTVSDDTTLTLAFNGTGGNKKFLVTGSGAATSTVKLAPTAGIGLTSGTSFKKIKVVATGVTGGALWFGTDVASDETDLEIHGTVKLERANTLVIGELSGDGTLTYDGTYTSEEYLKVTETSTFNGKLDVKTILANGVTLTCANVTGTVSPDTGCHIVHTDNTYTCTDKWDVSVGTDHLVVTIAGTEYTSADADYQAEDGAELKFTVALDAEYKTEWTITEVQVNGDPVEATAGVYTTTISKDTTIKATLTKSETTWPADWNVPSTVSAEVTQAFKDWVAAGNSTTAKYAKECFLLGLEASDTEPELEPVSITIEGTTVTITVNQDLNNAKGVVYLKKGDTLKTMEATTLAKASATIGTDGKIITLTGADGDAHFYQIVVDFVGPTEE